LTQEEEIRTCPGGLLVSAHGLQQMSLKTQVQL